MKTRLLTIVFGCMLGAVAFAGKYTVNYPGGSISASGPNYPDGSTWAASFWQAVGLLYEIGQKNLH